MFNPGWRKCSESWNIAAVLRFILQFGAVNGDSSSFPFFSPTFRLDHSSDQPCSAKFPAVNSWSVKLII